MRLRLETKAALFFCLLMAAGFGMALMYGFHSQRKSLLEMAAQRYLAIADNLGNQILRNYEIAEPHGLQGLTERAVRDGEGVLSTIVVDAGGLVVAATPRRMIDDGLPGPEMQQVMTERKPRTSADLTSNAWTLQVMLPIVSESGNAPVRGGLCFVGSLQGVQDELKGLVRRQVTIFLILIGMGLLGTVVYLRRGIVRPMRELSEATRRVVAGDFRELQTKKTLDEIGHLAGSFNWMAEELRKSREYLQDYNRTLMQMVASEQDLNRLDDVISSIAYALVEIDNHGDICRWNKAATDIFGLPPGSVLGRPLRDSGIPWDWSQVAGFVDGCLDDSQSWHRDGVPYDRPDQTQGYLTLTLSRVDSPDAGPDETRAAHILLAADVTERKRVEEELQTLFSRQEAILSAVPDIIMEVDSNKIYSWANHAGFEFFGEDVLGKEAAFYFEGEQATYTNVQPLFDGSESVFYVESWQRRKDGQKRLLAWWCRVLKDSNGNVTGALSSARDITERKRVEEMLRESDARYNQLAEQSGFIAWEVDAQGLYTYVSRASKTLLGYRPDELVGRMYFYDLHPESGREAFKKATLAVFERKELFQNLVNAVQTKDGRQVWVSTNGIPLLNADGTLQGYRGSDIDITDRKRVEEALRAASLYSRNLIETSLDALVTISAEGTITDVNAATEKITGMSREGLIGSDFSDCFTEPEMARAGYQKAFAQGQVTDYPLAVRHTSGTITDVLYNASVYRNEQGEVLGVFAAARDITEHRRAEKEVARLAAAVERSAEAIVITGTDGRAVYVNRAFELTSGFTREEIIGLIPDQVTGCLSDPALHRQMLETVAQGQQWSGRISARRKNGTFIQLDMTITPVRDETGAIVNHVSTLREITQELAIEGQHRQAQKV